MNNSADFVPLFKERSKDSKQLIWDENHWRESNEYRISLLWSRWVSSDNAHRYLDDDGFLIYGFLKNKQGGEE